MTTQSPSTARVASFLESADIGPLGSTIGYLLRLADARGLLADRRDLLEAARSLDWRVAANDGNEVVLPPPGRPIKLSRTFDDE